MLTFFELTNSDAHGLWVIRLRLAKARRDERVLTLKFFWRRVTAHAMPCLFYVSMLYDILAMLRYWNGN